MEGALLRECDGLVCVCVCVSLPVCSADETKSPLLETLMRGGGGWLDSNTTQD